MPQHQRTGTAERPPGLAHILHLLGGGPGGKRFQDFHRLLQRDILHRPGIHVSQRKQPEIIGCPGTDPANGNQPSLNLIPAHLLQVIDVQPAAADFCGNAGQIFGLAS